MKDGIERRPLPPDGDMDRDCRATMVVSTVRSPTLSHLLGMGEAERESFFRLSPNGTTWRQRVAQAAALECPLARCLRLANLTTPAERMAMTLGTLSADDFDAALADCEVAP